MRTLQGRTEPLCPNSATFPELAMHLQTKLDRLVVALVRFICASYVTEDAKFWHAAICAADNALGPVDGPALFGRSAAFVLAIRQDREREFHFLPAGCERVGPHELELLALLAAARKLDRGALHFEACRFTGADQPVRTMLAASALVGMVGRLSEDETTAVDSVQEPDGASKPARRLH
jgi:hypothetical protein